jgi:hypothetical protein
MKYLAIFMILAMSVFVVLGQDNTDDQGNLNHPRENERANACYTGASMEGKCDTEWAWRCGWYIIRFEEQLYTREQVPASCESLISPSPFRVGCQQYHHIGIYVDFGDGYYLASSKPAYSNPSCTIVIATHTGSLIYILPGQNALARCNDYSVYTQAAHLYGNIYACT